MHSWGSKEAENAAEGIRRIDGIKSTDEIKSTYGIKRKPQKHNTDAKSTSHRIDIKRDVA